MFVRHARISGGVVVAVAATVISSGVGPTAADGGEVCEGREDPPSVGPRTRVKLHL
jgi:hypothetical protein